MEFTWCYLIHYKLSTWFVIRRLEGLIVALDVKFLFIVVIYFSKTFYCPLKLFHTTHLLLLLLLLLAYVIPTLLCIHLLVHLIVKLLGFKSTFNNGWSGSSTLSIIFMMLKLARLKNSIEMVLRSSEIWTSSSSLILNGRSYTLIIGSRWPTMLELWSSFLLRVSNWCVITYSIITGIYIEAHFIFLWMNCSQSI